MSENQGRRIEGSEERGGFPWGWIVAGIVLLLLLLFIVPFACSALTGSGGSEDGSGGAPQEETTASQGEGASGGSGGAGEETAPEETAPEETASEETGPAGEGTAAETTESTGGDMETVNAELAAFGEVEGDGTSVTVPEATLTGTEGWLTIRDAGGDEGTILGSAPLAEGQNTDVAVEFDEPAESGELYAMIRAEDPADGEFTYPDGDPMIRADEGMAVEPFEYAVSEGGEDRAVATADGEPLPETGGAAAAAGLFAAGASFLLAGAGLAAGLRRRKARA